MKTIEVEKYCKNGEKNVMVYDYSGFTIPDLSYFAME